MVLSFGEGVGDTVGDEDLHWRQPHGSSSSDVSGCRGDGRSGVIQRHDSWNRNRTRKACKQEQVNEEKHFTGRTRVTKGVSGVKGFIEENTSDIGGNRPTNI